MKKDYFGEGVAERYDEGDMSTPEVIGPVVDFLGDLAGNGRALEFGIGTGRIGLPLHESGVPVDGIDLSAPMLKQLRTKPGAESVNAVEGDFTTTKIEATYSFVFIVFNTINNVTSQDEQVACFQNAADHLEPGGHFVIEVGVPELRVLPPGQNLRAFHLSETRWGIDEYHSQHRTSLHITSPFATANSNGTRFRSDMYSPRNWTLWRRWRG